jgi:hypothetical protein
MLDAIWSDQSVVGEPAIPDGPPRQSEHMPALCRDGRGGRVPYENTGDLIFGSAEEMDSILGRCPDGQSGGGPPHAPAGRRTVEPSASPADALPGRGSSGNRDAPKLSPTGAGGSLGRVLPSLSVAGARRRSGSTASDFSARERKPDWARRLWIGGWVLVACCLAYAGSPWGHHGATGAGSKGVAATGKFATKSIQNVRVGDRVTADNPELSDAQRRESDPDPANWIHLKLRMAEAGGGTLDIELLRPRQWAEARRAEPGRTISMDLSEMGAVGAARVLAVGPCPPFKKGSGRVVTGTFAHAASNVIDVRLDGMDEPISCTANHRFWSENRQAFGGASDLSAGERLRSADGTTVRVAEIKPRPIAERVYNIEVDVEHAYYVSGLGVLVHNSCGPADISMDAAVEQGANHVNGSGVMEQTGKGTNYQFRNTSVDANGNTVTDIARFDINPADPHVQSVGPHLNLESQLNGRQISNQHIPIDPSTVRQGDQP